MSNRSILLALSVGIAGLATASVALAERYPAEPFGRGTAAEKCIVCHSIEAGGPPRYAPNLYGIVGSEKAARAEGYGYSKALFSKGGKWTEEELDKYLADPVAYAPGTKKTIKLTDPNERKEIIAYLKKLAG